jgi:hypothetical protein
MGVELFVLEPAEAPADPSADETRDEDPAEADRGAPGSAATP